MKHLFKLVIALLLCTLSLTKSHSQAGVLDPSDPVVTYSSSAPPTVPNWNTMVKWVRTKRLSWNTDSYKAYFYNNVAFRLKFPKSYQHGVNDGKKYPVFIFLHGLGEKGTIYDNEYQLYHGGKLFMDSVDQGKFDGFLLFPQSQYEYMGAAQFDAIKDIVEKYLAVQVKADLNRVFVNGLSAGGVGTWDFTLRHPQLFAAALPMSAANYTYQSSTNVNKLKYVNIWHFQGGLDRNPSPETSTQLGGYLLAAGTNYKYTEFPNRGHDCWYQSWQLPGFFDLLRTYNKLNPIPLFGKYQFCEGETPNVTLAISAGFSAYEWRKNGIVIPGATSNTYQVNSFGIYDVRVRRGTVWSEWSPVPVEVKLKDPTIPPPIQTSPGLSSVIPSPSGNSTTLELPEGYTSYTWQKVGNTTTIGTTNKLTVTTPGDYIVKVTEQFGCNSPFSAPFNVASATGPNKPEAPSNVYVSPISISQLKVDWNENPYPANNETGYEIYKSTTPGGPYSLAGTTGANVTSLIIDGLSQGVKYYFTIRAVNSTAASTLSPEASGSTSADAEPPTVPSNLRATSSSGSTNSATITWNASTDNLGLAAYDIYINGSKSYSTTNTTFTCYNLLWNTTYSITVKARDVSGNISAPSNQINVYIPPNGLIVKAFAGAWNQLPDFSTLPVQLQRTVSNVSISSVGIPSSQENFGLLFEGFLNITTPGSYTFRLNSDEGSKLWLQEYDANAVPLVNNDGIHTAQNADGTITLAAGLYPISLAYFDRTGTHSLTLSWSTPTNANFVAIPNSAFVGTAPPAKILNTPSEFTVTPQSIKKIDLNWVDNSDDETGFEIWRSTSKLSGYSNAATVAANVTTYTDSIGLSPDTHYFYQIRSINQTGASTFSHINEAKWTFDGNYTDLSGANRTLSQSGTPTFDAINKVQGSHALNFNGTNQNLTIGSTNNFLREAYSERTIAFWMRSTNNTGNRVIVDIGGNDDGLCLRLNNNTLLAGIAANNVRVALNPVEYNNSNWNHVTLVYKANSLKLYLNGVLVESNTSLPFTTLTTTSNASAIGVNSGSNAFNSTSGYGRFAGQIDDFGIYSGALSDVEVAALVNFNYLAKSGRTLAMPEPPAAPSNLDAFGNSANSIFLQWQDNSNNETHFQIYRSILSSDNYVLIATLPANSNSYTDVDVFPNQVSYYKVRGLNNGVGSDFTIEDSAISLNNPPALSTVANQYMRFDTQLNLEVHGIDNDGGVLTLGVTGLPAFASYSQSGNTLTIVFNPSSSDQGTYSNISVTVTDAQGLSASQNFSLTVNDNYNPIINPANAITVSEMQSAQFSLTASDLNNDELQWSFPNLPEFVTATAQGNSVTLNANPGYTNNGTYYIKAKVTDQNFGFDTATIVLHVINVNPPNSKVYINFTPNSTQFPVGAPWNNTNRLPATNSNFPNLLNASGTNSGIGFIILTPWQNQYNGTNTTGVTTGNNSGVYPDNVMRTAYFTASPAQEMKFYGLNPNLSYSFTFFGSRSAVNDDRTSVYTINGSSVSLNAANNSSNTVTLFNVTPAADSSVVLKLDKGGSSAYGYLNALVIESVYNDGTSPAKPRELTASISNGVVKLTWVDAAYNEAAYEIYRATNVVGPFNLINPGANNVDLQEYFDNTISGNVKYYYTIRTVNQYGNSGFSDTVSIITPNTSPVVGVINDIKLKTDQTLNIDFILSDDAGDVISLSTVGLPAFASISNNGNGYGTLSLNPGSTVGKYDVTLTVKDDKGATTTRDFKITVTDKNITSYYVNFNTTVPVTESPWNSFNSLPTAGKVLANIKNDNDVATGVNITLVDAWESANDLGATTGNNSGIYPDNVMKTNFYESSSNVKRIRITGLSGINKKYNLIFFASRLGGDNRTTVYSVDGQSVSLNAANNISNTVQINGLSAVGGVIEFTAQKGSGSLFAYLTSLVIQEFEDNGTPLAPTNLSVIPNSNSSIQLYWNDKSAGEDGFEIYRSEKFSGPYTLLAFTNPNATTFSDNNLKQNTVYYYKVRAKVSSVLSDFSNIAATATHTFSVYMNFNRSNSAVLPWNNTNSVPEQDRIYTNMNSEIGKPTGLTMEITKNFNGDNPDGMNTGNNSGIVPDAVLRSSWWVDKGSEAQLKISGLNLNMGYTFKFVGSRNGAGDRTTVYTINGKSVSLNASYNTTQTVQLDNVRADENGEVYIDISMTQWALFGYLNGMIISGYQVADSASASPSILPNITESSEAYTSVEPIVNHNNRVTIGEVTRENVASDIKVGVQAFPNPFYDYINLTSQFTEVPNRLTIRLSDVGGRLVYKQEFNSISGKNWNHRINLVENKLAPGIYLLQLFVDNIPITTVKLVRAK